MIIKTGASLLATALVFVGCSRDQRPAASAAAEETMATEGGSAVESITEARCARESRCDNIGADKKYSSMEDCTARVRQDWQGDLDARECPSGINQTGLTECLTAIRSEDCSSPFDTLERVSSCTSGQICVE